MKSKLWLFLVLFCASCDGGNLVLNCGCEIDERGIPGLPSSDDYCSALNMLVSECQKESMPADAVRNTLQKVTIEWWDDIAPSPSTGALNTVVVYNGQIYSGLTIGYLCKVAWRGKLWRSAFVHELLHVIGSDILQDPDPDHQNQTLKDLESSTNARLAAASL